MAVACQPPQFTLSATTLSGYWTAWLEPFSAVDLPGLAIGTTPNGDWHDAADTFVELNKGRWPTVDTPAWLKESGAIYSHSGAGAGGILMSFPPARLKDHIVSGSFDDLDQLLDEAEQFGSRVVYLWDYWEGENESGWDPYFNKGDYFIRQDMGGEDAFRRGIAKIHARGGKVVCYLESYIVWDYSDLGIIAGELWGARLPNGVLDRTYKDYFTMIGASPTWQVYLSQTARRLVEDYGADGVFLDSAGWQMNRQFHNDLEGIYYTSQEYSKGVLDLVSFVRNEIRSVKPDAVVLGETTSGQLNQVWDGGLSADLSGVFPWMKEANQDRLIASPVRYANPERNYFSNGEDMAGLHQVFAAGHSLVLCNNGPNSAPNFMKDGAAYIKRLVQIRKSLRSTLVYGHQAYQPLTGDTEVAAYVYRGSGKTTITAVNTNRIAPYVGTLRLRPEDGNRRWKDLVSGTIFTSSGTDLDVTIEPGGLLVMTVAAPIAVRDVPRWDD